MDSLDVVLRSVEKEIGTDFIVRSDSSATIQSLTNTENLPLKIYTTKNISIPNVETKQPIVPNGIIPIEVVNFRGVKCTTPETTICEMFLEGANPQAILESMTGYYFNDSRMDWSKLDLLAGRLGILEEVNDWKEDAIYEAQF